MSVQLYCGDCLEVLEGMGDESIDMVITSPPYYNLRDYGEKGQIGQEGNIEEYVNKLGKIFKECYRVVKRSGSCWVNIDDVYINQSLAGIPDRLKIKMLEIGWKCRNEIIWHKPNAMPSSAKNRFNNDYEKLYFFVKSPKYYFETQYEALKSRVQRSQSGSKRENETKYENNEQEASVRQGMSRQRGEKLVCLRKNLPTQEEFVEYLRSKTTIKQILENTRLSKSKIEHWFRRDEGGFAFPSVEDWNEVKWLIDDWSEEFNEIDAKLNDVTIETDDIMKNVDKGRIKRSVWSINTKPFKGYHYATFPEELVKTPIQACCPPKGVVLDPFMGSGTVGVVCKEQGKDFIGIDINSEYVDIARERIGGEQE